VPRDESAPALSTDDEVLGGHLVEGLADRSLADAEIACDLGLARKHLPRLPDTVCYAFNKDIPDLPVQWTKTKHFVARSAGALQFRRHADPTTSPPNILAIVNRGCKISIGNIQDIIDNYSSINRKDISDILLYIRSVSARRPLIRRFALRIGGNLVARARLP
jgi:hypothetical protein